jgi:hypothetical protein
VKCKVVKCSVSPVGITPCVVNRHHFDADPDLDPNIHVDADPDPDRHQNEADPHADTTPSSQILDNKKITVSHRIVSVHCFFFLISAKYVIILTAKKFSLSIFSFAWN